MMTTDKAYESLQTRKTEFDIGVCTFNGCTITITEREEPYQYQTRTGTGATKCARYWGHITFPNGRREYFSKQRGGEIARSTGFAVTDERKLYKKLGDNYLLPYQR